MSLLDYPESRIFLPSMRIEVYGRDGSPQRPRFRIEFHAKSSVILAQALAFRMVCVECGDLMHPFRVRRGEGHGGSYFAASCPLEVSIRCSRTPAAALEYRAVRAAVDAARASQEDPLYEDEVEQFITELLA